MRLIDADALKETLTDKVFVNLSDEYYGTMQAVDEAPTIDAVEVVRCRDCVSFRYDNGTTYCAPMGLEMQPTDFCSYGERKDDETD